METKQLRVGNYIERHNKVTGVKDIIQVDGGTPLLSFEGMTTLQFNPIPLTEKWLMKFGFEEGEWKDKTSSQYLYHKKGTLHISDSRDVNYSFESPCKHVHQLQNLFFALTGEELELK